MNNLIKIFCIFFYLIFTQVSPFIHWHAHEHEKDFDLHFSIHPPEFPINDHNHNLDHEPKHDDAHEHPDSQIIGDWVYTFKTTSYNFKIAKQSLMAKDVIQSSSKDLNHKPKDFPLKILHQHSQLPFSLRAPPQLS